LSGQKGEHRARKKLRFTLDKSYKSTRQSGDGSWSGPMAELKGGRGETRWKERRGEKSGRKSGIPCSGWGGKGRREEWSARGQKSRE